MSYPSRNQLHKWLNTDLLSETSTLDHLVFANFSLFSYVWNKLKNQKRSISQKFKDAYYRKDLSINTYPKQVVLPINSTLGKGVFAKEKPIPTSTFLGEYTGLVRKGNRKLDKHNPYLVRYPIKYGLVTHLVIDAKEGGNHTKFYNHSRKPNAALISIYCEGIIRMICISTKAIAKDKEITIDYGYLYWKQIGKLPQ